VKTVYDNTIDKAIELLKSRQYNEAHEHLHCAISIHDYRPEAYNLLGVLYEKKGDSLKAIRFYRVSYYFDQSYKPATNNLERMTDMYRKMRELIDYGEE